VRSWLREERVDHVHLAAIRVLALLRARQTARHEEIPELLQAPLFTPGGFLRRGELLDRKRDVRPVERRKPEARLLAMRDGEAAERSSVEGAFEGHDEAAVAILP